MDFKPIDLDRDYDLLCQWWTDHGALCVPKVILPRGWFAVDLGVKIAASFLYVAPEQLAMIEYTTTNPRMSLSRITLTAVKGLYARLEEEARELGCVAILSMVAPNTSEERIMTRMGYATSEQKFHRMYGKPLTPVEAPCLSH